MKKLPIGQDYFRTVREDDLLYIDKTPIALDLINRGSYYFLSRPRRFGKSLFLSTLKEIFSGSQDLFEGLYIYDKWDFSKKHPVIHISLATGFIGEVADFNRRLRFFLKEAERQLDIKIDTEDAAECLQELIWQAREKYQQKVVVLIDEYDKPILDNITKRDKARALRDELKVFYSVLKTNTAHLRFVFITGVSKFSKMSLFSGLNNIDDITLEERFGNICGYTHENLITYFGDYLQGVDLNEVKAWYNGYNFFGEKVYNPYDILLFINKGFEFRNHWWQTGSPNFLIELLREKDYHAPDLLNYVASEEILNSFDVDTIELEPLLWQTGYLTIAKKVPSPFGMQYELTIPNKEVQTSLTSLLITHLTGERMQKIQTQRKLVDVLQKADTKALKDLLISLFASIAHHNYTNNSIAHYEGYYASVIYAYLASLGYPIIPEDITNKGRIDLTLKLPDKTYIFEFKAVDAPTQSALQQIKERKYYQKYDNDLPIYLVGIEFGKKERNIVGWAVEKR
ncbi:MAG: ATP-binding protein [Bacteroidota bacterium]